MDRKAVTEKAADFQKCIYSTLRQNWNNVEKSSLTARHATVQKLRRAGLERHERGRFRVEDSSWSWKELQPHTEKSPLTEPEHTKHQGV